jgi:hypothetical protein
MPEKRDPAYVERVLDLYAAGWKLKDIGAVFGRSESAASLIVSAARDAGDPRAAVRKVKLAADDIDPDENAAADMEAVRVLFREFHSPAFVSTLAEHPAARSWADARPLNLAARLAPGREAFREVLS